jgi:hypothetical protein
MNADILGYQQLYVPSARNKLMTCADSSFLSMKLHNLV